MSTPSALTSPAVARLSVAPVKGLALQHPHRIELTGAGAIGDRQFFLIDVRNRLISVPQLGALLRFAAEFEPVSDVLTLRREDGRTWSERIRLGDVVRGAFHDRDPVAGRVVEGPWSEVLSDAAGQPVRLLRALDGSAFDV